MGRIRPKIVKRASRQVIERYFHKLTLDFDTNKKIMDEVVVVPSKRIRNKIAGFTTHLMKRIQRGPVRGISLKIQEEERERRLDFVPERSVLDVDRIFVDDVTLEMLDSIDMSGIKGVELENPEFQHFKKKNL
jgi:small subunit ribosomal protein S17e